MWFSNITDRGGKSRFYRDTFIKNGYLHFHETYDHQNCAAGTSREFTSLETNQAATADFIILKSRDLKKDVITLFISGLWLPNWNRMIGKRHQWCLD